MPPTPDEKQIGLNHAGLALLGALSTPVTQPSSDRLTYSDPRPGANGLMRNLGWLRTFWHWNGITIEQWTQIKIFAGACNIVTPDNDDVMREYTALMILPMEEPEHYGGGVLDVTVEFRKLILVP